MTTYMNQVAENGKVRPLPVEVLRKLRSRRLLGVDSCESYSVQAEISGWDEIRKESLDLKNQ